ncbi:MAG: family 10 glycosylhydrolase [Ruminococcus sp.]|nr:family 10 glycosylhydrolase [Ruminococcus sp.]
MKKIFFILAILIFSGCSRIGAPVTSYVHTATTEATTATTITTTTTTIPATTTTEETTTTTTTAVPETTTTTTTVPTTTTVTTTTTTTTTTAATTVATTIATNVAITVPAVIPTDYNTLNYREQKGVWISYLEYQTILKNRTKEQFRNSINAYFDNIVSIGFNTVYVQLRAFGDAYYSSSYFPRGKEFSGKFSTGSIPFDPLEIMIKSAHDRGLSVHGWINPMRLGTTSEINNISDDIVYKKWIKNRTDDVFSADGRWYLNPSSDKAVSLIVSGAAEICTRYNIDGIQIDDYFYPDSSSNQTKIKAVNALVKSLYSTVHTANPDALFGISPQGTIENNLPLSADVEEWVTNPGYCDYILPQVYFGFENWYSPFEETIGEWSELVTAPGVKLVIGLAPYKIGLAESFTGSGKWEWANSTDIIARQMAASKKLSNYGGVALFRYDSLFNPTVGVAEAVSIEVNNIPK